MPENKIWTIGEIIERSRQYLAGNHVDNPRLDAELLLCHIIGKERVQLYVQFDQPLQKEELDAYRAAVMRRAKGEPVAYIVGRKHFFRLELAVNSHVLTPRPETELLAEAAVKFCRGIEKPYFLDIGTGSGALVLGILSAVPGAGALAVDVSPPALEVAKYNAQSCGLAARVEFRRSDIYTAVQGGRFHLIVSNPPYIPSGDWPGLPREVRKEPRLALDGGKDGLVFYRRIIAGAGAFLLPGGLLALELGAGQAAAVVKIAEDAGFRSIKLLPDYAGIDRVFLAAKGETENANKILAGG